MSQSTRKNPPRPAPAQVALGYGCMAAAVPIVFGSLLFAFLVSSGRIHHLPSIASIVNPMQARIGSISRYREIAMKLDPDIMGAMPMQFNSTFRAPCWYRPSGLTCLPYFLVLGGFQSGANALYTALSKHPDIVEEHNPRPHFWAEHEKKVATYLDGFQAGAVSRLWAAPQRLVFGDASESSFAFYLSANNRAHRAWLYTLQTCVKDCPTSKPEKDEEGEGGDACRKICWAKARKEDLAVAREVGLPQAALNLPLIMRAAWGARPPRLIVMLRDPVERLHTAYWSHEHYLLKYGATAQGFLRYVQEQAAAFGSCTQAHPERECALLFEALDPKFEEVFFHADQLLRGIYWVWLEGWLAHFSKSDLLILLFEQYRADPKGVLTAAAEHLGLSNASDSLLTSMKMGELMPEEEEVKRRSEPMLPEARQLLEGFYRPHNVRLQRLLRLSTAQPWAAWQRSAAAAGGG